MSLINRMLSDLEERRGGNLRNVDQAIDGLRAAPPAQRPRKKRIPPATLATGLVITALLALCGYLFFSRPPATGVAQTPMSAPAAAPQITPPVTVPAQPGAGPAPAASPAPASTAPAQPVVITDVPSAAPVAEPPAQTPPPPPAETMAATPDTGDAVWPEPAPEPVVAPAPAPRQPMLGKASTEEREEPLVETQRPASSTGAKPVTDSSFRIAEAAPASTADRAVALLESGDTAGAEALLREGLAGAPGDAAMAQVLGHILLAQNDARGAVSVLRPAAPALDADPDYHALLAAAEQRSGDHESAARRYRELLTGRPGNGAWLVGLGISLQALGDAGGAADTFLQALADPSLPAPLHDFAMQHATQVGGTQR